MMSIPRFDVLGVSVSAMDLTIAREAIVEAVRNGRKGYVCVTGVHGVIEAQDDPEFRRILNESFLNTTDGMPLVWLGRHYVRPSVQRVYGPDLMLEVFEGTRDGSVTHFFYGGAPGVAEELQAAFEKRTPGVRIVGTYTPPFRPLNEAEEMELAATLERLQPDIVWVGLSTPKQEKFMAKYLPRLQTKVMIGVGAAFDFHSGRVRQAPLWIQRSGFEWFYRLCCEPKRLAKRYLINNPRFVAKITQQLLGA